MCIYIYIYMQTSLSLSLYIYIYIYMLRLCRSSRSAQVARSAGPVATVTSTELMLASSDAAFM